MVPIVRCWLQGFERNAIDRLLSLGQVLFALMNSACFCYNEQCQSLMRQQGRRTFLCRCLGQDERMNECLSFILIRSAIFYTQGTGFGSSYPAFKIIL